jgi:hypothetical protein
MIVLGPLILLAVGALAVSGISTRHGAHSPARCGLLSYRLPGAGCRLFFLGLVLAAAAMSGLARIVTGLGRGVRRFPAARQLPHVPPRTAAGRCRGDQALRGHEPHTVVTDPVLAAPR